MKTKEERVQEARKKISDYCQKIDFVDGNGDKAIFSFLKNDPDLLEQMEMFMRRDNLNQDLVLRKMLELADIDLTPIEIVDDDDPELL